MIVHWRRVRRVSAWMAAILAVVYLSLCGVVFARMQKTPAEVARFLDKMPDAGWMLLPMESLWLFVNRGGLRPGDVAPDFDLAALDGSARVRLSSLRGRPVVLFFGSYTCPPFRRKMPDMNGLYERYKDRARFYFVYVEEAHATDGWPAEANQKQGVLYANHKTLADRIQAGGACSRHLKIPFPMLVDDMDNHVEQAYRAWPIRVYVVDADGRVAFKSRPGPFGFEADEVKPALARLPAAPAAPTGEAPPAAS